MPAQPFSIPTRGMEIPAASVAVLGGSPIDASSYAFCPALDYVPRASRYGSNRSERPIPNETKSGARPRNLTARDGNAC